MSDVEQTNDIKKENNEEKSDFKIIDSYCMNHITSANAHVSGDCDINETQDDTGQLIDLLLEDIKQEPLSEKICDLDDECIEECLATSGAINLRSCKKKNVESSNSNNICAHCDKVFGSFAALIKHIHREHVDEKQYHCAEPECIKSFTNMKCLKKHIRQVHGDKNHACEFCDYKTSHKRHLARHRDSIHVNPKPRPVPEDQPKDPALCIECEKSFTTIKYLKKHTRQVHGEKRFSCELCDYKTSTAYHLTRHHNGIHLKQNLDTSADSEFSLISDTGEPTLVTVEPVKPYKCPSCDDTFSRSSNLNRHYRQIHCIERQYSCEQCAYKCVERNKLRRHQRTVHDGVREFICGECLQEFSQKDGLKKHMISVHCGVRPFTCTECERNFSTNQSLKAHLDSVHEGLKPHACQECGKSFSRKSTLQCHINGVHTKEKMYPCTYCEKSFLWRKHLYRHINVHHVTVV